MSAVGVIFNDLNGDGKRQNVAGGLKNERGVAGVTISMYVGWWHTALLLSLVLWRWPLWDRSIFLAAVLAVRTASKSR